MHPLESHPLVHQKIWQKMDPSWQPSASANWVRVDLSFLGSEFTSSCQIFSSLLNHPFLSFKLWTTQNQHHKNRKLQPDLPSPPWIWSRWSLFTKTCRLGAFWPFLLACVGPVGRMDRCRRSAPGEWRSCSTCPSRSCGFFGGRRHRLTITTPFASLLDHPNRFTSSHTPAQSWAVKVNMSLLRA